MERENPQIILETERLLLREMTLSDLDALSAIMCDEETMREAYVTPFTREETAAWLRRHQKRYETLGFGLWAVILKETGEMIGQCGLTLQSWREQEILEIGYLFNRSFWHRGYAAEAAIACKEYAFSVLKAQWVYSTIRESHLASQKVALKNGMQLLDKDRKIFRNTEMDFLLFGLQNERKDGGLL